MFDSTIFDSIRFESATYSSAILIFARRSRIFASMLLLTTLVAWSVALPAAAQTAGKKWEAGFEAGSMGLSGSDEFDVDERHGGRVGAFLNDHFQIELQAFQASAFLDSYLRAALVNLVFQPRPDHRVVPYGLIGAGGARLEDVNFLNLPGGDDEEDDGSIFQAGIGARFFPGDHKHMALRLELSSQWIDTDVFGDTRNTSLVGGITWSFGSR